MTLKAYEVIFKLCPPKKGKKQIKQQGLWSEVELKSPGCQKADGIKHIKMHGPAYKLVDITTSPLSFPHTNGIKMTIVTSTNAYDIYLFLILLHRDDVKKSLATKCKGLIEIEANIHLIG